MTNKFFGRYEITHRSYQDKFILIKKRRKITHDKLVD